MLQFHPEKWLNEHLHKIIPVAEEHLLHNVRSRFPRLVKNDAKLYEILQSIQSISRLGTNKLKFINMNLLLLIQSQFSSNDI